MLGENYLKKLHYVPRTLFYVKFVLQDINLEKEYLLFDHSEKLIMCFGIIKMKFFQK